MIVDLQPYPAMKDSTVPWLGEVPEHWDVKRLKSICRMKSGEAITAVDLRESARFPVFGGNGIRGYSDDYTHDGSHVLIGRQGALCGNVHYGEGRFWASEHAVVVTLLPRGFAVRWLGELLRTMDLRQYSIGAAQPGLAIERILGLAVPVPPSVEQPAIARFLDHADRRILRYIRAKQRLITLLHEQKQTIVHRAVIGGLDPDARLTFSGMEGLGEVPKHWEMRRAKHLFREVDQRSESGDEELLSVSHLTGVSPRSQKNVTMFRAPSNIGHKLCEPGDLVINTMWAWMGALGVASQRGLVSPAYGVYRPLTAAPVLPDYVDLLLTTKPYIAEFRARSTGIQASRLRLYPDEFLRIPILSPPVAEQRAIVAAATAETSLVTQAVHRTQREVELIRECRARLISDVVTGKLDVREASRRLPDDEEESEALDDVGLTGLEEEVTDDLEAVPEEVTA